MQSELCHHINLTSTIRGHWELTGKFWKLENRESFTILLSEYPYSISKLKPYTQAKILSGTFTGPLTALTQLPLTPCPTTHTPVWLPAQKNPNHTLQSFPWGNTILCYPPHNRKWFKMVHSSPTTHFRHCCSETSKGRCLHHQGFLCIKGLHLYIFIYFLQKGDQNIVFFTLL